MTIYIIKDLLEGINIIAKAGYGVEIDGQSGGNNRLHTHLTIVCRTNNAEGYVKNFKVRHTLSYQWYSSWTGVSGDFESYCYAECPNVSLLLNKISRVLANLGAN